MMGKWDVIDRDIFHQLTFHLIGRICRLSDQSQTMTHTIDMRVYDRENVKTIIEKLKKVANMQEVQQIL